jgi:iron complex outermembrane receptor protein
MTRFLYVALLSVFSVSISAQQATLRGKVVDAADQAPLFGVSVVTADGKGVATDVDGNYTLILPAGRNEIRFTSIGYEQVSRTFDLVAGEERTFNVTLKIASQNLDLVVVSAGKFEQDYGQITVSMEVIKPQMIENRNTINIDDVLQQTPGVSIVDGEPQIRSGSGYSFGAGSRVMVLLDDLPILSGDAGRPSWGFLPIENIQQIEVIKGASSVLYGSAALSGVINMRTAYPTDEPLTKITTFVGGYSAPQTREAKYWEGTPMLSGFQFLHSRKIGQWDLVVGGNLLGDDGHLGPIVNRDANGAITDTASSRYNPFDVNRNAAESRARINANIRYRSKARPGLQMGLNTNWLKGESLATLVWGNVSDGLYNAFEGSATRTKQLMSTVDPFVEYTTDKGSSHSLRGRWQQLNNDNDNNQGNFSDVFFGQYQFQQNFDRWGVDDMKTTLGFMGMYTEGISQLYSGSNEDGNNTASNYAAFMQVDKVFNKTLTVSAGVRYEYFEINQERASKPVFRTGVNYQFGEASFVRGSFGQGFRFPSIAEKFIETAVGVINIYPNNELQAESSWNAELGIKQGFKIGNFKGYIDVAAFRQEYENFVEFTFGQWNRQPSISNLIGLGFKSVNTGRARVDGIDLSIIGGGKIGKVDLAVLGGYTYTKPVSLTPDEVYAETEVDPGFEMFVSPEFAQSTYLNTSSNNANNILKYRMQHLVRVDVEATYKKVNLGGSVRYNSYMQNIDKAFEVLENQFPSLFNPGIAEWRSTRNLNGDFVIDARLGYQITEEQRISLIVSNVLNREYAIRPLAIEAPRVTVLQYNITF